MEIKEYRKMLGNIRPSERQQRWFDMEMYAFIHFSPNTFTDREWGLGDEDPAIFNPVDLDCDSWVAAIKAAGLKGAILTAKHHDGFCLWQTKTTEHSIKNSPYKNGKGDIVRELSDACRRGGIKFGFYLSPWDRNSRLYGTPEYNDFFRAQLTELLTGYGEVFECWFDEACGEGENGKKQVYEFDSYFELIRKYQPNAVIYNDHSPDVRWIGNEKGKSRHAEWSVVPYELCHRLRAVPESEPVQNGTQSFIFNTFDTIGDLENIIYSKQPVYVPAEVDTSIRRGWFYHNDQAPHTLEHLQEVYLNSVGRNACLNLNIPPMKTGLFSKEDTARLLEFGAWVKDTFSDNLCDDAKITRTELSDTQCLYDIVFPEARKFGYLVLQEDISQGQRVASFAVQSKTDGTWWRIYDDTCIGHKRICRIDCETDAIKLIITSARDVPQIKFIGIYR